MATQTTAPTQAPQAPATLDGVSIQDCQFTESASSLEPRPPLFRWRGSACGHVGPGVHLAVDGGRVVVVSPPSACKTCGHGTRSMPPGTYFPVPPIGPAYTGPITPAMWVWIRKYWKP